MDYSRREFKLMLPALAVAASAQAQDKKILPSKAFKFEDLPVRVSGENQSRAVLSGETHSAFAIELHMTDLGPGQAQPPPHKHVHEEMLMLQKGVLDATISGQTTRLTAGSVIYLASNDEHGWRNPGPERAQY